MYIYSFKLSFAKKRTTLNFDKCKDFIIEAINNVNEGIAFKRDNKNFQLQQIEKNFLFLKLESKESLTNPSRTISALTRYLTTYHIDVFGEAIYNKTLFNIELLSHEISTPYEFKDISNEDLVKTIIDLLYGYTAKSNSDTLLRNKTIQEMKQLIIPFIKKQ